MKPFYPPLGVDPVTGYAITRPQFEDFFSRLPMMGRNKDLRDYFRTVKNPEGYVEPSIIQQINEELPLQEEEKELTVLKKKRRRSPSSSSSEEKKKKKKEVPKPEFTKSLVSRPLRKIIEFNIPVFLSRDADTIPWHLSLTNNPSFYESCIPILAGINTVVPTIPADRLDYTTSQEFLLLKRIYRTVIVNNAFFTYDYDFTGEMSGIIETLPTISFSITSAPPIGYVNTDDGYRLINYYYEDNAYFQPYNDKKSDLTTIIFPEKPVISKSQSINSWSDCSELHMNTLSLNLGYLQVPKVNPSIDSSVYRIGTVSIFLDMTFGTPHTIK